MKGRARLPGAVPFARPRVVLSQCLELSACRYNGQSIRAPFVPRLMAHADVVPVCPEVEIGLGIPRPPIRLVAGPAADRPRLVQPETGRELAGDMRAFADRFLGGLQGVDGFVLKSRSPSCGLKDVKIYAAAADAPPVDRGPGVFAAEVLARFPTAAVEDEGRLTNLRLRHHFLTRLFALAELREVGETGGMAALGSFHARYKLLLYAHGERQLRELGPLVANAAGLPFPEVVARYHEGFARALARPARPGSHINALQHAQGFVSEGLTPEEKQHFAGLLDAFLAGQLPLAAPLAVLRGWAARFGVAYLEEQRYFLPYPDPLLSLDDSGSGALAAH